MPEEREFVRKLWEKYKPWAMTYLELEKLYEWFLNRCDELGIDPWTIDFEAIVDNTLSYYENQARLERELVSLTPAPVEFEELEYYKKRVEELERRIRELEKQVPEEEIERLKREVREWKEKYERAKRTIEEVKRTPGLTEEDVAKIVRETIKEVTLPLGQVLKMIVDRIKRLEETAVAAPVRVEIPPEVVEKLAAPTIPEPKVRSVSCIECGKKEPQFVEETLFLLMKLLPLPTEYFYLCDECRSRKLGMLPPEKYLQDLLKPKTIGMTPIPPEYIRWAIRATTELKRAKGTHFRL